MERYLNGEFELVEGKKVYAVQPQQKQEKERLSPAMVADLQAWMAAALEKQGTHVESSTLRVSRIERDGEIVHSSPVLLSPRFSDVCSLNERHL